MQQLLVGFALASTLVAGDPTDAIDFEAVAYSCRAVRPSPAQGQEPRPWVADTVLTAKMWEGLSPAFRFAVAPGQVVRLLADQSNLDVILCLYGPDNRLVLALDAPFGTSQPEELMWHADSGGEFVVSLGVSGRSFGEREVELTLALLSAPTARDLRRAAALGRTALADEIRRRDQDPERGLALFDAAIEDWRGLGDRHRENAARLSRARLSALTERHDFADHLRVLVPWLERDKEEALLAWALMEIARDSSRPEGERVAHFSRALALYEGFGSLREQAIAHNELGKLASERGEEQAATEHFAAAIRLAERWGDPTELANALYSRGRFFVSWSRYEDALGDLLQSLGLRASDDHKHIGLTFEALGAGLHGAGNSSSALSFLDRALALHSDDDDGELARGVTLQTLGLAHQELGHELESLSAFRHALRTYARRSDAAAVRRLRFTLACAYLAFERTEEARRLLERILTATLRHDDPELWAAANFELARLHHRQGRPETARPFALAAVEGLESWPYRVSSLNLRNSFLAERLEFYDLAIEVLVSLDRHHPNPADDTYRREALEVSDRSRSHALRELILRPENSGDLSAHHHELSNEIRALRRELQQQRRRSQDRRTLEVRLESSLRDLDLSGSRLRLEAPLCARPTTRQIQEGLIADTALLHFRLTNPRSRLWVLTRDHLEIHELAGQTEIEAALDLAWKAIGDPLAVPAEIEASLREASRLLFGSLGANRLPRRLIVVGNGRLQAFPLGAVADPAAASKYRPLLADHEIVLVPSGGVLSALEERSHARPSPQPGLLVVADPAYSKSYPLLPQTRREAAAIDRYRGNRPLQQLVEARATRRAWLEADPARFGLIHLATHGEFDPEHPLLSQLIFAGVGGQDEPLYAYEMYDMSLAADLVVLSGCETGRGALLAAEGVLGLSHGFLAAGADRVLVTLWQVEDEPTARLFEDFYERLLRLRESPERALQEAQARMWQRQERFDRWAPFLLIGRPGG
jgi:tetratricopeptide (TPR) repeat protein